MLSYEGTPEMYGAKGDGYTDDTDAIQQCLNNHKVTKLQANRYRVHRTLTVPFKHSIDGNHSEIIVTSNFEGNRIGQGIPSKAILYMEGRTPAWRSELDSVTQFVRDLRIRGNDSKSFVGIFMGMKNPGSLTAPSSVNNAVYGAYLDNVSISHCDTGLYLAEAWSCTFNDVSTEYLSGQGLYIKGQSVNNTFTGCWFGTTGEGNNGILIDGATYNGEFRRPEGNTFNGGLIGSALHGVRMEAGLAFKFSNVVIGFNKTLAIVGTDFSDVQFTNCYIMSKKNIVEVAPLTSKNNETYLVFDKCMFSSSDLNAYALYVNPSQAGVLLDGCMFGSNYLEFNGSNGTVVDCTWNFDRGHSVIRRTGSGGVVRTRNNRYKATGAAVPESGTVSA